VSSLSLRDVAKDFGGEGVLRDVDLDVADGSTLALLGPSGSGKSTLLRIVAGLEVPDRGRVLIGEEDVTTRPVHRRGVGFVFQDQALFPHLDVAGNVAFGLRMGGVERAARRRRVAEALELVGLPGYEGRDAATLSGGEAQRVAIARALAPRPALLLLDEPLAALDQLLRERLLVELRALFDELAVTVVAVTHDPTEAAALGDRIAVLLDGRIAQEGPAGEVIARPRSSVVAGLVGQRNVLVGTVVGDGIDTPIGRLRRNAGARSDRIEVLVPPGALRPDPTGALVASVRALLFRGGTAFAVAAIEGERLDVLADPAWRVGDEVRLAVDVEAVQLLDG